jgi:hypothetical protein
MEWTSDGRLVVLGRSDGKGFLAVWARSPEATSEAGTPSANERQRLVRASAVRRIADCAANSTLPKRDPDDNVLAWAK